MGTVSGRWINRWGKKEEEEEEDYQGLPHEILIRYPGTSGDFAAENPGRHPRGTPPVTGTERHLPPRGTVPPAPRSGHSPCMVASVRGPVTRAVRGLTRRRKCRVFSVFPQGGGGRVRSGTQPRGVRALSPSWAIAWVSGGVSPSASCRLRPVPSSSLVQGPVPRCGPVRSELKVPEPPRLQGAACGLPSRGQGPMKQFGSVVLPGPGQRWPRRPEKGASVLFVSPSVLCSGAGPQSVFVPQDGGISAGGWPGVL